MNEIDYDLMGLDINDRVNEYVVINMSDGLKEAMAKIGSKDFHRIKSDIFLAVGEKYNDTGVLKFKITNDIIENLHQVFNSKEMEVLSGYITLCDSKTGETIRQQEGQLYILFKQPDIGINFDDEFGIDDSIVLNFDKFENDSKRTNEYYKNDDYDIRA